MITPNILGKKSVQSKLSAPNSVEASAGFLQQRNVGARYFAPPAAPLRDQPEGRLPVEDYVGGVAAVMPAGKGGVVSLEMLGYLGAGYEIVRIVSTFGSLKNRGS